MYRAIRKAPGKGSYLQKQFPENVYIKGKQMSFQRSQTSLQHIRTLYQQETDHRTELRSEVVRKVEPNIKEATLRRREKHPIRLKLILHCLLLLLLLYSFSILPERKYWSLIVVCSSICIVKR